MLLLEAGDALIVGSSTEQVVRALAAQLPGLPRSLTRAEIAALERDARRVLAQSEPAHAAAERAVSRARSKREPYWWREVPVPAMGPPPKHRAR